MWEYRAPEYVSALLITVANCNQGQKGRGRCKNNLCGKLDLFYYLGNVILALL